MVAEVGAMRRTLSFGHGTLVSAEPFPLPPKAAGQKLPGARDLSSLWANLLFSLVITICQSLLSTDSPSPEIPVAQHFPVRQKTQERPFAGGW